MPRFPLSRNVAASIAPPIPKAQAWAASYRATADKPLLNLSQGVPGDPPHEILRDALVRCTADPKSAGYGPILGEPDLRRAVAREMAHVYRFDQRSSSGVKTSSEPAVGEEGTDSSVNGAKDDADPPGWEEVAITAGCNQAFFDVMLALCESGDKVIVPVPWYFNMLMTFQILNITPLPLPLASDSSFLPSVSAARALLDSPQGKNTKAIVLVTPNNPTGATYPPALIDDFADLARERRVALIVDETYRDFLLPDQDGDGDSIPDPAPGRPHTLFERSDWRDHVISLSSFSKSYKIPGHRLGMIVAGQEVLQAVTKVADSIQICAPRPPQLALIPTLPLLRADLAATSSRIHARLVLFESLISRVRGWRVISRGGFYAYVQHPYVVGPSSTNNNKDVNDPSPAPAPGTPVPSERIAEILATRCGILTLPGAFFMPVRTAPEWRSLADAGSALVEDKWIRFAIANVSDDVVRGVPERLEMLNEIMEREYGCQVVE